MRRQLPVVDTPLTGSAVPTRVATASAPTTPTGAAAPDGPAAAACWTLVALSALAVVVLVPVQTAASAVSEVVSVMVVAAGGALAASGLRRQASLTALTGLVLTCGLLAPPDSGPVWARWLAITALPVVCPLAGASVVRMSGPVLWLLALGAALGGPVRALVYDPFLDPGCVGCPGLPTLVALPGVVSGLALFGGVAVVVALAFGVWREREDRLVVVALLATSGWALSGWGGPRGVVPAASQVACLVLVGAAAWTVGSLLVARRRLRRFAAAVESRDALRDGLRRALGDSTLTVDFVLGDGVWVDVDGRDVSREGSSLLAQSSSVTLLRVGAGVVARAHHRPDAGRRAARLSGMLTSEVSLALEHAALTARLRAQVRLLAASRLRVVEAADETRRRLERDLHDGAQQQLLALGFDVRGAQAASPDVAALDECVLEVRAALDDLRAVASGVHPALLTAAGLRPALEAAAASSAHPIRLGRVMGQRCSPAVERSAYLLVVDAAEGGPVEVEAVVSEEGLRVSVAGLPLPAHSTVPERVAALGGSLVRRSGRTEMTLPCG